MTLAHLNISPNSCTYSTLHNFGCNASVNRKLSWGWENNHNWIVGNVQNINKRRRRKISPCCPKVYLVLPLWLMFVPFISLFIFLAKYGDKNNFIQSYPTTLVKYCGSLIIWHSPYTKGFLHLKVLFWKQIFIEKDLNWVEQ